MIMSNPYQFLIDKFGVDEIKIIKMTIEGFITILDEYFLDDRRDMIQDYVKKKFPQLSDKDFDDLWDYYETKQILKGVE